MSMRETFSDASSRMYESARPALYPPRSLDNHADSAQSCPRGLFWETKRDTQKLNRARFNFDTHTTAILDFRCGENTTRNFSHLVRNCYVKLLNERVVIEVGFPHLRKRWKGRNNVKLLNERIDTYDILFFSRQIP